MVENSLGGQKARHVFNERMLNHWFADDYDRYIRYYNDYNRGEAMLANLKRDDPFYYAGIEQLAEDERKKRLR